MYNQMVVDQRIDDMTADGIFHALADATRRDIVRRAMSGDHSISALAGLYPMSFAAVQKHVAVLEGAGLVSKTRRGREQLVKTEIGTVRLANRLLEELEEVWRARLERFDEILAEQGEGVRG